MSLVLAGIIALVLIACAAELLIGHRAMRRLPETLPKELPRWPAVSVIVAGRDEARHIERAMRSLLAQDYPDFEVIAVDDRSTDATGAILDAVAAEDSRLAALHVRELSAGWLGKNHALHLGAAKARGELLLFTDADVIYTPTALRRAVAWMRAEGLDHLTMSPRMAPMSPALTMAVAMFFLMFSIGIRPWRVRNPKSRFFIGIGAFNLIRRTCYDAVGGHRAVAMRPDDDIKLGKLIKKNGWKQDIVLGNDAISIEWYASVRELVHGLTKNMFAGADYSQALVIAATVFLAVCLVWPFAAIFVTTGTERLLYGIAVACAMAMVGDGARLHRIPWWSALGTPFAAALLIFIFWKSTLTTLFTGGITWRGTHYPLSELKKNRI